MRYRLRTLMILMTLVAVAVAFGGNSVARAVKDSSYPKPRTRHSIFDADDFRKLLEEWRREWNGDPAPEKEPPHTHGGWI